jgi:hypothetical protein
MGEEDIFSPQDRKDEQQSPGQHEKDHRPKKESKEERKGGMDILQPHHRDVPQEKDQKKENQAGDDQKANEDPLLWSDFQDFLQMRISDCGFRIRNFLV